MKTLAWLLLLAPVLLLAGAIALNAPPLLDPPGWWPRLKAYLSSNVVQTAQGHRMPELRLAWFEASPAQLRERVLGQMRRLGWTEIREEQGVIRAQVVTPLLRFTDDVEVRIEARDGGSLLHVRSASRLGKADLAANQRHVRELLEPLQPDSRL